MSLSDNDEECFFNPHATKRSEGKKRKKSTPEEKRQMVKNNLTPEELQEHAISHVGCFYTYEKPLEADAEFLLSTLLPFYTVEKLEQLIVPRSLKTSKRAKEFDLPEHIEKDINTLSLRSLEWLVTNYSKKFAVVLYSKDKQSEIDIHSSYRNRLGLCRRSLFDPFCRDIRVYYTWNLKDKKTQEMKEVVLITTVGQLNFMKWADEHDVIQYAKSHHRAIQSDMETTLGVVNKEKKEHKAQGIKRKRQTLSKKPLANCMIYNVAVNVNDIWDFNG